MTKEEYNARKSFSKWHYLDGPMERKLRVTKHNDKYIHLITFQDPNIWRDIYNDGVYVPSAGFGDSSRGVDDLMDKLGYYPVWAFHPLTALQVKFKPFWFTDTQFTHMLWQNFQKFRQYEWKNLAMFELRVPVDMLTEDNTDDWTVMIPEIRKEQVVAIYQFFICDRDREYPTTDTLPYIRVLRNFDISAMLDEDFAPALWSGKYTGDDELDFNGYY